MSTHWTLLTAGKAALESALGGLGSLSGKTYAVKIKKRPHFDRDRDTDAKDLLVVLSPQDETVAGAVFDNAVLIGFPVLATAFVPGRQTLTDAVAVQLLLGVREACRLALHRPTLAAVPGVYGCEYEGGPVYDAGDTSDLWDLSRQRFVYSVKGARQS